MRGVSGEDKGVPSTQAVDEDAPVVNGFHDMSSSDEDCVVSEGVPNYADPLYGLNAIISVLDKLHMCSQTLIQMRKQLCFKAHENLSRPFSMVKRRNVSDCRSV